MVKGLSLAVSCEAPVNHEFMKCDAPVNYVAIDDHVIVEARDNPEASLTVEAPAMAPANVLCLRSTVFKPFKTTVSAHGN